MFKRLIVASAIAVAVVVAVVAFAVFRQPEAASSPIEAIPLATSAPAGAGTDTQAAGSAADPDTQATGSAADPDTAAAESAAESAGAAQVFEIVAAESQARFVIDEVLRGADVTVVGATDQVAGQIAVDPASPATAQVGVIQVNARTLATDNDFRNRAIKNAILATDSYEYVTFTPTALSGLPASVAVGTPFSFQMSGDLTVKDTTRPVTFEVTVTPLSATELSGTATTSVLYQDFNLAIPDSPMVDTVADEVRLELDFVARAIAG